MAGWFAGYLGKINAEIGDKWEQLDNFSDSWNEGGKKLDCFIELSPLELFLDSKTRLVSGRVYYEYLRKTRNIEKKDGKFKVIEVENVIDARWSDFWLTQKSYIIIEKGLARQKGFELVSSAIFGNDEELEPITFDLERLHEDYPAQWLGGFYDREGHIHSGTLYGEDISHDAEMGDAYVHTRHKNQIGYFSEYFGPEIKIKVTREGFLQIYTNLHDKLADVFEFVRDELEGYILYSP